MSQTAPFVVILAAYLLGSIPFSFPITSWVSGEDIRERESGKVGATNVLRTQGKLPGIIALALDLAKGWCAIWLARTLITGPNWPWPADASEGTVSSGAFRHVVFPVTIALVVIVKHNTNIARVIDGSESRFP